MIDQLQSVASRELARWTGAEAGAVTHCVAAGITLSVAASMVGLDRAGTAGAPPTGGRTGRVVIPAIHAIDYGHPVLTDIRLAGAVAVLAGSESACSVQDVQRALADPDAVCLLLVASRLVRSMSLDLKAAVAAAHRRGVLAIIDGAAQDLRLHELLATGADAVLTSAHKYLASPTAGVIVGRRDFVAAFRAQEQGIGRAMKATKEGIVGVLAALDERSALDLNAWQAEQQRKVDAFLRDVNGIGGLCAHQVRDPAGMPFSRVALDVDTTSGDLNASSVARELAAGDPSIRVMEHAVAEGRLMLELVPLDDAELRLIIERLSAAVKKVNEASTRHE